MSLVCGFNMFKQLMCDDNSSVDAFQLLENSSVLDFSWSGILFKQGKEIKYRGFVDDKLGETIILKTPDSQDIIKGCCKQNSMIFLTKKGECWELSLPDGKLSQLIPRESNCDEGLSQLIIDLAASDNITLLLNKSGEVFSHLSLVSSPGMKVREVACGIEHSVFLCESGLVYSWGSSSRGQLGHGDIESKEEPVELAALSGLEVKCISAGGWHTCAVTSCGDLYSWGWNHHGQLGLSSEEHGEVVSEPKPVDLPDDSSVVSVSCGTSHTAILLGDSSIFACGSNKWSQLGFKSVSSDPKETIFTKIYSNQNNYSIERVHASHWNTAVVMKTPD